MDRKLEILPERANEQARYGGVGLKYENYQNQLGSPKFGVAPENARDMPARDHQDYKRQTPSAYDNQRRDIIPEKPALTQ